MTPMIQWLYMTFHEIFLLACIMPISLIYSDLCNSSSIRDEIYIKKCTSMMCLYFGNWFWLSLAITFQFCVYIGVSIHPFCRFIRMRSMFWKVLWAQIHLVDPHNSHVLLFNLKDHMQNGDELFFWACVCLACRCTSLMIVTFPLHHRFVMRSTLKRWHRDIQLWILLTRALKFCAHVWTF
jgi:hypothetical protein